MKIGDREIGPGHLPFIIAEVGINHRGNMDKAFAAISEAALAGADCVKFQCHIPEEELCEEARRIVPCNSNRSIWEIISEASLSEERERELKQYCDELGIVFLSTPFSLAAVERLERLGVAAYKIGSGELKNKSFLSHVASKGKPMIVSTGMGQISDVADAIYAIRKTNIDTELALLHCTSSYPTHYEDVRLPVMNRLEEFHSLVGLSDHSPGIWVALGAVALGASIIEKHFALPGWQGEDVSVSIVPRELRSLVHGSRAIWQACSSREKIPTASEQETEKWYLASRRHDSGHTQK